MTKKSKALRKFDYMVDMIPSALTKEACEEKLDAYGQLGWELVQIDGERAVYKRLIE